MSLKVLYVFVEGSDDERFFRWYFRRQKARIIKYAQEKRVKTDHFIRTITSMEEADYIFLTDKDNYSLNEKMQRVKLWYPSIDLGRVYIAVQEIESWYLAGLSREACNEWKIHYYIDTNDIVKEDFNEMIPRFFPSRMDFMAEILKRFSFQDAIDRNQSFRFFLTNNRR
jgi:hypothetical protein